MADKDFTSEEEFDNSAFDAKAENDWEKNDPTFNDEVDINDPTLGYEVEGDWDEDWDEWNPEWGEQSGNWGEGCGNMEEEEENPPTLTERTKIGGASAKWKPEEFAQLTSGIAPAFSQEAIKGLCDGDNCAIMHLNDEQAAVFAMDWFPAMVDDPYDFGAISATSSLSPLYAAGAKPVVALNIMALPCKLGLQDVGEVMRGGSDKVIEAGAFVVGGHSIDDAEPKYGLATFGIAHPDNIIRNERCQTGDVIFYTKPLGTGILYEAFKAGVEFEEDLADAVTSMKELNKPAANAMDGLDVHGASDVGAMGLVGQLHTILESCERSATLHWDAIGLFDRVWEDCQDGYFSKRCEQLCTWAKQFTHAETCSEQEFDTRMAILCDPQTSGGLLVVIPPEHANAFAKAFEKETGRAPFKIGEITDGEKGAIELL